MAKKQRTLQDSATDKLAKMAKDTEPEEPKEKKEEDLRHLNTRVPKQLIKKIRIYCAENDMNIQDFVAEAVKEKLKKDCELV